MIAGVLVLWDSAKAESSVHEFQEVLRALDSDNRIIVVSNNPTLRLQQQGVELAFWNNQLREFGAWDHGLTLIEQEQRNHLSLVVFANDTFLFHRSWGRLERYAFVKGMRFIARHDRGLAGAASTFHQPFRLRDVVQQQWISTYLFAITPALLQDLDWKLSAEQSLFAEMLTERDDEEVFFSMAMDRALSTHLVGWLFGRPGQHAWRNSTPLTASNLADFIGKAQSILCEIALTARCLSAGATIHDVNRDILIRLLKTGLQKWQRLRLFGH
jgi:hypothetical protein